MKKHWKPTNKYQCTKCRTVWDPQWVEFYTGDCPFCVASSAWQKEVPATRFKRGKSLNLLRARK